MKFKTTTGSIIEPKLDEVAEEFLKAGYEVIEESNSDVTEKKATKKSKAVEPDDVE